MRIAAIGDVHGESRLLRVALDALAKQRVDLTLCVGDISDGVGSVDDCCRLLQERGVETVAGNHERWLLTDQLRTLPNATDRRALLPSTLEYLAALPRVREYSTPLGPLLLCHGLGADDMASVGPDDFGYDLEVNDELDTLVASPYRLVVNGHTHRAMVRSFGKLTVVNAGSLRPHRTPCYLVLSCDTRKVSHFTIGFDGSAVCTLEWRLW